MTENEDNIKCSICKKELIPILIEDTLELIPLYRCDSCQKLVCIDCIKDNLCKECSDKGIKIGGKKVIHVTDKTTEYSLKGLNPNDIRIFIDDYLSLKEEVLIHLTILHRLKDKTVESCIGCKCGGYCKLEDENKDQKIKIDELTKIINEKEKIIRKLSDGLGSFQVKNELKDKEIEELQDFILEYRCEYSCAGNCEGEDYVDPDTGDIDSGVECPMWKYPKIKETNTKWRAKK